MIPYDQEDLKTADIDNIIVPVQLQQSDNQNPKESLVRLGCEKVLGNDPETPYGSV